MTSDSDAIDALCATETASVMGLVFRGHLQWILPKPLTGSDSYCYLKVPLPTHGIITWLVLSFPIGPSTSKCGVKFLKPTVSVTAAPVGRSGIQLTLDLDAAAHPQLSGKHLAAIETSSGLRTDLLSSTGSKGMELMPIALER
jgi:hypothetical protein